MTKLMMERRNRAAERIAARRNEPEVVDLNEAIFLICGFFILGFICGVFI